DRRPATRVPTARTAGEWRGTRTGPRIPPWEAGHQPTAATACGSRRRQYRHSTVRPDEQGASGLKAGSAGRPPTAALGPGPGRKEAARRADRRSARR
ncbi:hypothetical protein ACFU99_42380, partial [Streptomyces sp. NPDC057654]|uniref:hypothetical protein n=1 Tax=Streptomyces sp. NPDC057654 TaxID=3346196 RepID=UPI003697FEFA